MQTAPCWILIGVKKKLCGIRCFPSAFRIARKRCGPIIKSMPPYGNVLMQEKLTGRICCTAGLSSCVNSWAGQDDPALMNRYYMEQLSRHADLLEEAEEICNILYKKYKLYIITNGSSLTQHGRFAICPLTPLFQNIFISEDMGVKKPQKAYFDAVAAAIPGFDPQRALVIGDSLSSDILGANHAGWDCCWYNPQALPNFSDAHCTYEIRRLRNLLEILP